MLLCCARAQLQLQKDLQLLVDSALDAPHDLLTGPQVAALRRVVHNIHRLVSPTGAALGPSIRPRRPSGPASGEDGGRQGRLGVLCTRVGAVGEGGA